MQKQLLQVAAFMSQFNQPVHWSPIDVIPTKIIKLRMKLADEEQEEFNDAFVVNDANEITIDKVEALDALCDRMYILLGDIHTLGLGFHFPVAFRRVHESNMTKLWTTEEKEAQQASTGNFITFTDSGVKAERRWLAVNSINKVVKSPSYQPAALADMFDDLDGQELLSFDCAVKHIYGDAPEQDVDELTWMKEFDEEQD